MQRTSNPSIAGSSPAEGAKLAMEIKTKYSVGDEVYFIEKEKILRAKIKRIYISVNEEGVAVEYRYLKTISYGSIYTTIKDPKKTIEELYQSGESKR